MTTASLEPVTTGRAGALNVFRHEGRLWWRTSRWWLQLCLWTAVLSLLLVGFLVISAQAEAAGIEPMGVAEVFPQYVGLAVLLSVVGVTVLTQGAMLDERRSGTLQWVLSKPVSREAMLLAKYAAHAAPVLLVFVLGPWAGVYAVLSWRSGGPWPVAEVTAAAGLVALLLLFTLSLVLLLGTLSTSRALVVGIPIAAGLLYDTVHVLVPDLAGRLPLPWELTTLAVEAAAGEPLTSVIPVLAAVAWTAAAIAAAAWRFRGEEIT